MRGFVVTMSLTLAVSGAAVLANDVHFNAPADIGQKLRVGEQFEYSLCLAQDQGHGGIPGPGQSQGQINPWQSPCGTSANPSTTVAGGNPPYHFVLDSGGFPPMGIVLDNNGVLRGTPRSTMPARFRVCAVDQSANRSCQEITLQAEPPLETRTGGGANTALVAGLLGGAAALGVGAAAAAGNLADNATSNTRACSGGQTDCADGRCCDAGQGCCGLYEGREVCCPGDYPHYCRSTNKCYRTMPDCNFSLCGGVIASARGVVVGAGPMPGAVMPGDPAARGEEGVPATLGCEAR